MKNKIEKDKLNSSIISDINSSLHQTSTNNRKHRLNSSLDFHSDNRGSLSLFVNDYWNYNMEDKNYMIKSNYPDIKSQ